MTQEDEDLMLDNFVTFFIAGEFELFLLWCIKMLQNKQKVLNLILIDFSLPTYLITVEIKNTMTWMCVAGLRLLHCKLMFSFILVSVTF